MPKIIVENTGGLSGVCHSSKYEKTLYRDSIYQKLQSAEVSIENGNVKDGFDALNNIKEKYEL